MASRLSDEVLGLILSHALHIRDEHFAYTGYDSPFDAVRLTTGGFLRVCKRWARIGLPCLYDTVILVSNDQASALSQTLTSHSECARYIRKLRLEGAYDISTLVQLSPDVTDLAFSLAIKAKDNVESLVTALEQFNPQRVIVVRREKRQNKMQDLVLLTLCVRIGSWSNLKEFVFYQSSSWCKDVSGPAIADALAQREQPTIIFIPPSYVGHSCRAPLYQYHPTVRCLSPNVAISSIIILDDGVPLESKWQAAFPVDLLPLVQPVPTSRLYSHSDDNFDETADLGFLLEVGIHRTLTVETGIVRLMNKEAVAKFRDLFDLCSPHFQARDPIKDLVANCSCRIWIPLLRFDVTMQLQTLIIGRQCGTKSNDIRVIGATVGSCLRELTVEASDQQETTTMGIFRNFKALKRLSWQCNFAFKPSWRPVELPELRVLYFDRPISPSFFTMAAEVDFPSLEEIHYDPTRHNLCSAFLVKHGNKIRRATLLDDWDEKLLAVAPELQSMVLLTKWPDSGAFTCRGHAALQNVELNWRTYHRKHISEWQRVVHYFSNSEIYPALKEVKANGMRWPQPSKKERERNPFAGFSETLGKRGVVLKDETGSAMQPLPVYI